MRRLCVPFAVGLCLLALSGFAANDPSITQQPASQSTTVGQPVTFSVTASGTAPLIYEWRRNAVTIPGATSNRYTLASAQLSDSGAQFSVRITNGFGMATSQVATLTVNNDTTPPTVSKVFNTPNLLQLKVKFSERMDPAGANESSNYSMDGGVNVNSASLDPDGTNVTLNVSALTEGQNYILTIFNITDLAANFLQPNPTDVPFQAAIAPMIAMQPQDHKVASGDPVSLFVTASGTAPLTFQWFKNNVILSNQTTAMISFAAVTQSDLGGYRVVVANSAGSVTSAVAQLSFYENYTLNLPAGFSFVADQLVKPGQSFPIPPDGTIAYKWSEAAQMYSSPYSYIGGLGWDPQELTVNPGEGVLLNLPIAASLTFYGDRMTPVLPVSVGSGLSLLSAQVPIKAGYLDIVGQPQEGSVLYRFKPTGDPSTLDEYNYRISYFRYGVWHDSPPVANVGESVFVQQISPVVINTQPMGQTNVPIGQSVSFSVNASGSPPIRYQWHLNGTAIPGATNSDYFIDSVRQTNAGIYRVSVGNVVGDIISDRAPLTLDIPNFNLTDSFASQGVLNDPSRLLSSHNRGATREAGEPQHLGKRANASVWLTWVAPFNGLMTMNCSGSGFDTILAAYRGNSISNLTLVDASDDDAGYACSRIVFNAIAGIPYRICVAGLGDETGDILLGWNLQSGGPPIPEFGMQPQDLTVGYGDTAQFFVTVTNGSAGNVNYQWFRDGVAISGATFSTLTISNVSDIHVGTYYVHATLNSFNTSRDSRTASLQVEVPEPGFPLSGAHASAKFFDLTLPGGGGGVPFKGSPPPKLGGTVNHGYSGAQTVSSVGVGKDPGEPNHCGYTGGNSVWYTVQATNNGTMYVNTDGSSFNTVLAAYIGPGNSYATLTNVACDNNSGLDGLDSRIAFTATSNTIYFFAVDGVGGASGTVKIAFHLVRPLIVTNVVYSQTPSPRYTMTVVGTPNLGATVQFSTNAMGPTWTSLVTTTNATGTFNYTNTGLSGITNRYYRAVNNF